ncbi:hypothetical protein GALMADRAFT_148282 [Galerina marginata CBS 339.88]|uniref:Uncharacterized protein n=1 Tax=Galerina marginata (strain CBS 339.88) TaxID=685588 RepID=A0A067S7M2_GALM3|nr:hypothetical protein GALMADRAFT_148282 [Galerina marginata CBS 339.88]
MDSLATPKNAANSKEAPELLVSVSSFEDGYIALDDGYIVLDAISPSQTAASISDSPSTLETSAGVATSESTSAAGAAATLVTDGAYHEYVPASERWYSILVGHEPGVYRGPVQALEPVCGPHARIIRHHSEEEAVRIFEEALFAGSVRRYIVPAPIDEVLSPADFTGGYVM